MPRAFSNCPSPVLQTSEWDNLSLISLCEPVSRSMSYSEIGEVKMPSRDYPHLVGARRQAFFCEKVELESPRVYFPSTTFSIAFTTTRMPSSLTIRRSVPAFTKLLSAVTSHSFWSNMALPEGRRSVSATPVHPTID